MSRGTKLEFSGVAWVACRVNHKVLRNPKDIMIHRLILLYRLVRLEPCLGHIVAWVVKIDVLKILGNIGRNGGPGLDPTLSLYTYG